MLERRVFDITGKKDRLSGVFGGWIIGRSRFSLAWSIGYTLNFTHYDFVCTLLPIKYSVRAHISRCYIRMGTLIS